MTLTWSALIKLVAGIGLPILAMFSAYIGIKRYGAAEREAGRLEQRVAGGLDRLAMAQKRAKEREADDARQLGAWERYAAFGDLLREITIDSNNKVATYAQTDAGRAPCLDLERVRDINATAARAGLPAAPAAQEGDGAVPAQAAARQGSE